MTRREGFVILWDSIKRPAFESRETPYQDVQPGTVGFLPITYAKSRNLLDDDAIFRPEDPLSVADALMWLLRTRNYEDIDGLTWEALASLHASSPLKDLVDVSRKYNEPFGSAQELSQVADKFDHALATTVTDASLYSEKFHGKGTAFGETFDMYAMTAAHRTFPHNTMVRVTNLENGKQVIVRVNDRGPFVHGRSMDLSLGAFTTIAERSRGVIKVNLERLGDKDFVDTTPTPGSCVGQTPRFQRRLTKSVIFTKGIPHVLTMGQTLTLGANNPFVVRKITSPDGTVQRLEQWVHTDEEQFTFTPTQTGIYRFYISDGYKRGREFRTAVGTCSNT